MAGVPGRSGGRNAKTVAQLRADNTFDPSRHDGIENPDPPKGRPTPPKELQGDALAEWDRMIVRLELSNTLSMVDDAALYQYCRMFDETEELALCKIEAGASVDILEQNLAGLQGAELVQCFQEITKLRQLEAGYATKVRQGRIALRAFLVEFGMTPAARSRVKVVGPKKDEQVKSPLATLQAQARQLRAV